MLLQCCAACHPTAQRTALYLHPVRAPWCRSMRPHAPTAPIVTKCQSHHNTFTNGTTQHSQPAGRVGKGCRTKPLAFPGSAQPVLHKCSPGRHAQCSVYLGAWPSRQRAHRRSCALLRSQRPLSAGVSAKWLLPPQQQSHAGVCTMQLVHTCHVCRVHGTQRSKDTWCSLPSHRCPAAHSSEQLVRGHRRVQLLIRHAGMHSNKFT